MTLDLIKKDIPKKLYDILKQAGITTLRPSQKKSLDNGLLKKQNLLVCTPTASGKTLVAELAALNAILKENKKAIYIVPLKALALEKFKAFKKRYGKIISISLLLGDLDSKNPSIAKSDLIVTVSEKLDSMIRHHTPELNEVSVVIIDEIHLINSANRGPTLEILITILRTLIKDIQIIGLSATIGNPEELAGWLDAKLIIDSWRPVELKKGIYNDGKIEYY